MNKTPKIQLIELRTGKPLRQAILDAFAELGNMDLVAESFGVTHESLRLWRKQMAPPLTRKDLDAARKQAQAQGVE